jgi:hypothetical protein
MSENRRLRTPAAAEYLGIAASTLEKMRVAGARRIPRRATRDQHESAIIRCAEPLAQGHARTGDDGRVSHATEMQPRRGWRRGRGRLSDLW